MATIVASITLNIMLLDPIYTHVPRGFWFFSLKSAFQQSPLYQVSQASYFARCTEYRSD